MKLNILCSIIATSATTVIAAASSWPNTPFKTYGRQIVDQSGNNVVYAGVNWPGAADTMLPEGLQYQSIKNIVNKISILGANVIRLTYAIEMIDDVYSYSPNSTLQNTLINALGTENGTKVLHEILKKNLQFTPYTTRLEVFDAVAAECANQQIYVHLDNHVSKAEWCCSNDDGNAWFGDTYFNVTNWRRGLAFMADHAKSWKALTSMSLRNELREPTDNATLDRTEYNWADWYDNVIPAANGIHANNPNTLIFFSGENFDTTLAPVTVGADLGNGRVFDISKLKFPHRAVFELHNYQNGATNCSQILSGLYTGGYNAMNLSDTSVLNHAPVVLTEFGFGQDNTTYLLPYSECIREYHTTFPGGPGGWMQWVLAGSYYIRQGTQDEDESWGLLNHDWSAWRSPQAVQNYTKLFIRETLKG